ncbi:MAG: substrate-binding domain-containing protein [Pseudomonadota bacterium]
MADGPDGDRLLDALRTEFSELGAGTRLPTIRSVAGRYGVSQFAAQRAFESLKEKGLIQSFVGRGSFVAGSAPAAQARDTARILVVSHTTPSTRGAEIARELLEALSKANYKSIQVEYSDVSDLHDLLGRGGFDVCVLQPRRSVLPVEALALLKSKARHMIVEGRQLELMNVDVFVRNRAKSIATALSHLRELGHVHIGLLTERLDGAAGYGEIDNLFSQMLGAAPDQGSGPILRISEGAGHGSDAIGHALKEALKEGVTLPTAMIVSGSFHAKDIVAGFQSAGLGIPNDIGVVHLRAAEAGDEFLTTVGRDAAHVARGINELITWRLANPNDPSGLVLDDPVLKLGQSTIAVDGNKSLL